MPSFTVDRSLLNPKFEGYKFDPVNQADLVHRHALQYRPTQATVSGVAPLSFPEMQSRITHNHLSVACGSPRAAYVDSEHRVILIEVDLVCFSR